MKNIKSISFVTANNKSMDIILTTVCKIGSRSLQLVIVQLSKLTARIWMKSEKLAHGCESQFIKIPTTRCDEIPGEIDYEDVLIKINKWDL